MPNENPLDSLKEEEIPPLTWKRKMKEKKEEMPTFHEKFSNEAL